ncbi:tRNA (cytosine(34)-C(5))-methyltransferase [Anthonomus grandis grandis]|uniref:tRNA (cytosine(34)-C(5))-methyltransferase n=1 Tax=Anthonomus grandis grandis TaxID=2921223 RepID=UPI0021654912|nr:tRNA (cytosine(34)-C(5))-methyltransferase [Anthonomus grandis grandis]
MGRRKPGFRKNHYFSHQKRHQKDDPAQKNDERKQHITYNDIVRENEKFVEYYRTQNVCKPEEFDQFIQYMKTDLPSTFRITGSKGVAKKMLELVEGELIKECVQQEGDHKPVNMFPLPWYPDKLAWQLELTRKDIRRLEAYYKLHNFLISETEHGTISRQETVSMIPPLALDVQPHHKILDMCAAPGSKTAQLLELLHKNDDPIPSGYVIANDVDNKRCYMLVHQAKRLNSPCVAVINHDSACLPNMLETLADGSTQQIQFDRILCDVPCSGDGTLRKNPDIWMKWTPANALNLHGIQYRILRRAAELLTIGGRIVYSTCSINPVENEAVIHRMLVESNGALELVNASESLPGLKYTPGMEDWLVSSRNLEFYKTFEEVDEKWKTTIRPQMFPPKTKDKSKYHLDRCIRILPHQQNTGAFFVAVLQKVSAFTAREKKNETENVEEETDVAKKREFDERLPQNQRKRRRKDVYREDPYVFFKEDEEVWTDIKSFYNISDKFDPQCLLTRCNEGKKKNIYLTSAAIRDLVITNQDNIKFINTGVKAFVRCDNKNMKCAFRIANDGLESIYPYIGDCRKVTIPKEDLIVLLTNNDPQNSPQIVSLSKTIQDQVENLSPGSCILVYTEKLKDEEMQIHISGWRGTTSLRCYTTQHSTVHLLRLLGGDISKYDVSKFKKSDEKPEEECPEATNENGTALTDELK